MGSETGIPWADKTFNTHFGCTEVSPECDHCYAREFDARFGGAHWGKDAPRRFFGEKHWNDLVRWNRAAERGDTGKDGRRILVFVDSMSDLFESRDDLDPVRAMFWDYARRCRALCLLLLTKRPQNIARMVPADLIGAEHIWYGTTVGLPDSLWRADALLEQEPAMRAPVRFLSMEPLLAETSIAAHVHRADVGGVNWCVAGSESGDGARPMATDWLRLVRDECAAAGVAFFAKQADATAEGITGASPHTAERNAPYRRRDLRKGPDGIRRTHWIIERPLVDGVSHCAWPA